MLKCSIADAVVRIQAEAGVSEPVYSPDDGWVYYNGKVSQAFGSDCCAVLRCVTLAIMRGS
jgi:hypothetical protein